MHPRVAHLISKEKSEQRSEEWHAQRKQCITASEVASALKQSALTCGPWISVYGQYEYELSPKKCLNPYQTFGKFIEKKVTTAPREPPGEACLWGIRYERIACDFYQQLTGQKVIEFGFLLHDSIDNIGASPDGITESGRMLEIKCPFGREVTRVVPLAYWCQIQLQLEVAQLDVCDFFDVCIQEYLDVNDAKLDEDVKETRKGAMLFSPNTNEAEYPDKSKTFEEKILWCKDNLKDDWKIIYFRIYHFELTPVYRHQEWFDNSLPRLREVWEQISQKRAAIVDNA